jgi:putative addiction module component (TIGR02574 family)
MRVSDLAKARDFSSMRRMPPAALNRLLQLPRRQRLEIAERLWNSVAGEDRALVPEAHKRVLRQRLADYKAGKLKTISHAELLRRVRAS